MRTTPGATRALSAAPRAHLFTISRSMNRAQQPFRTRHLSTSTPHQKEEASSVPYSLKAMPSPPRLPKEDQEIFESLQRQSTGAFSTPISERNMTPSPTTESQETVTTSNPTVDATEIPQLEIKLKDTYDKTIEAKGKGEELHPNVRRGAQPEFEGDVNPKTGEVGGPKNDPLRWGAGGEWTYNGRATDF